MYLACRSEGAASGAIQELQSAGLTAGNGELAFLKLDLSNPEEAKRAAEEFLKLESRLDVLSRCQSWSMFSISCLTSHYSKQCCEYVRCPLMAICE